MDLATQQPASGAVLRWLLSVGAVTLVSFAGYGGFRFAAGLDVASETGAGVAALAVLTGFAVFFSPCSFPLLVALLAGSDRAVAVGQRRRDSIKAALAIGAGAAVFLLIIGLVVGLVGEGVVQSVGFSTAAGRLLRAGVSLVIIGAGLTQLGVLRLPFWRVTRLAGPIDQRRSAVSRNHPHAAQVLYGFGFIIAGFG
jgi:cytochrome c biogenesis protein CcdA